MPTDRTDPPSMNPLQRLITEQMRVKGWTPEDVKARGIAHATLHYYTHPFVLKTTPKPATMRKLATALELDYQAVFSAALETVGWSSDRQAPSASRRKPTDPTTTRDEVAELRRRVEELERIIRKQGGAK